MRVRLGNFSTFGPFNQVMFDDRGAAKEQDAVAQHGHGKSDQKSFDLGARIRNPNYTPGVDFLDHDFL